jgi:uncharacterized protein (TIGR02391 family)
MGNQAIPQLTKEQQQPLALPLVVYLRTGRWPTFSYIDEQFYAQDVDVSAVLRSLPTGLYQPDRRGVGGFRFDDEDLFRVTITGVAACDGLEHIVKRFLRGLEWSVRARKGVRAPSPHEVADPTWRFAEFAEGLKLEGEEHQGVPVIEATLVLDLMYYEPDLPRRSGPVDDPTMWTIKIPRSVRRYEHVRTIEDFLATAHPPPEPPPANPFVFPIVHDDVAIAPDGPATPDRDLEGLHPEVSELTRSLFDGGHYDSAIFEAFKALNNRVKAMTGLATDGQALMSKAMSPTRPIIRFNEGKTQTDRDEQQGLMHMFMGAMGAVRNPRAHEHTTGVRRQDALEHLGLASLLMRRLDSAAVGEPDV